LDLGWRVTEIGVEGYLVNENHSPIVMGVELEGAGLFPGVIGRGAIGHTNDPQDVTTIGVACQGIAYEGEAPVTRCECLLLNL
jgi:hypothetical protein